MKKKISAFLLIGVIALISMGFRSQVNIGSSGSGSVIEIVKGQVVDVNNDDIWDFVTFGLDVKNPGKYAIASIEIFDRKGELIGTATNLTNLSQGKVSWYSIDLESFRIRKNFTLEVHVASVKFLELNSLTTMAAGGNTGGAPIDPEETILIVKYP